MYLCGSLFFSEGAKQSWLSHIGKGRRTFIPMSSARDGEPNAAARAQAALGLLTSAQAGGQPTARHDGEPLGQLKPYLMVGQLIESQQVSSNSALDHGRVTHARPRTGRFGCEPRPQRGGVRLLQRWPQLGTHCRGAAALLAGQGQCRQSQAAAGSVEGRWSGEHPPPGSLVLLIPANCTSRHRAMGEVTPWPGMEQLRDLLLLKPGESSALPGFYFIWTELRIRQIILLSSVNVLLLQESWMWFLLLDQILPWFI